MGRKGARNTRYKVKNRSRDIDQIYEDVKEENIVRRIAEATEPDEDLPALGQFFCVSCNKYFINERTLLVHKTGKPHKRRLKALVEQPHTQDDADFAAGLMKDDSHLRNKKLATSAQDQSAPLFNSLASYACAE
ncbi:Bud site selection protein 20 [Clonorchis sinensis]|uniref:Bud site selection protein 20 n=2 Tax=Opisthorchiidae TaxID=6196 RepID=A0A8T1MIC0_CLOSI|nr:hypothetical protein T265_07295 [Opisthorchis viverrini]KAG5448893.1 Bud site selection protein 20 [Clonorchis sinensis]KER25191.1 hypothetical protein T265_07295 [Opisthorchis viverrini]